jgi:2-succinyl-5-enolpyruvyl-6-hydroxy-3-cyclohexene-1-carboxylate synthase
MYRPAYFIGLPKSDDIKEFLTNHSELFHRKEFLFPKGSPFTNKSVQDFLDENKVQYHYVNKKEIPLIVRISTLYMKRMSEINIEKNKEFQSSYLYDLMDFWNQKIVLVAFNLASDKLMSETKITERLKKELFKRLQKSDPFQMQKNKQNYIFLLVIVKRYLKSKAPETSLILLNAFS